MIGFNSSLGTSTHAKGKKGFFLWAELCQVRCPTVMGRLAAPHFIQAHFFPANWVQGAGWAPPQTLRSSSAPVSSGILWLWHICHLLGECHGNAAKIVLLDCSAAEREGMLGPLLRLCWLMLPSGGETPQTSQVFVADLSGSDLL